MFGLRMANFRLITLSNDPCHKMRCLLAHLLNQVMWTQVLAVRLRAKLSKKSTIISASSEICSPIGMRKFGHGTHYNQPQQQASKTKLKFKVIAFRLFKNYLCAIVFAQAASAKPTRSFNRQNFAKKIVQAQLLIKKCVQSRLSWKNLPRKKPIIHNLWSLRQPQHSVSLRQSNIKTMKHKIKQYNSR